MTENSRSIADVLLSGGIFILSGLAARPLAFIGHIIVVRWLSPSVYGNIALSMTVVSAIAPIALFGLGDGFARQLASKSSQSEKNKLVSSGLLFSVLIALTASILIIIFTPLVTNLFDNQAMSSYLPLFSMKLFFAIVGGTMIGILRGYKLSRLIAVAKDFGPKLGALVVLLSVASLLGTELTVVSYYIAMQGITVLVAGLALWKWVGVSLVRPTFHHARNLFSFSWPLAISSTFVMLMLNADILFLGYLSDSTSVGQYRSVRPLAQLILIGLTSVVTIYMPVVTEYFESGDLNSIDEIYTVVAKWLAIFTFPLVGVFVVFSPEVVSGFFGSEYEPAAIALAVLSIGMYGRVIAGPNGATTQAINRPRTELYAGVFGFIINIFLNAMLIPSFGLTGAAIATSTGFLAYNSLELGIIYIEIQSHPFSLNMVKPLVPSLIIGTVLFFTAPDGLSIFTLVALGLFWTIAQLLFVPLTRSFDQMDKNILLQFDSPIATQIVLYMERLQKL